MVAETGQVVAGFLKDTPDWVKLLGVLLIVFAVDRYGSMAHDVEKIKEEVSVISNTMLIVQGTLNNHEVRIDELEANRKASDRAIEALEQMTETIWKRLERQETPP